MTEALDLDDFPHVWMTEEQYVQMPPEVRLVAWEFLIKETGLWGKCLMLPHNDPKRALMGMALIPLSLAAEVQDD